MAKIVYEITDYQYTVKRNSKEDVVVTEWAIFLNHEPIAGSFKRLVDAKKHVLKGLKGKYIVV